jgi:hypothetical protein
MMELDDVGWAWLMHFGCFPGERQVTCRDCDDYKVKECEGGGKPEECMKEKIFIDEGWVGT